MQKKKIGIISQSRMGSTRLPGKILKPIAGKPLLQYQIDRMKESGLDYYIATTIQPKDDAIVAYAEKALVPYYRGSEDDVLSRYYECAKKYGLDIIVRVTSDNPLTDGGQIRQAVEEHVQFPDFLHVHYSPNVERTYPIGMNFEVFSFELLADAHQKATDPFDREHVTPYIIQNKSGNVTVKHFKRAEDASEYRITVDTADDFELMKMLIEQYHADHMNMEEIIALLQSHPELVEMNKPEKRHSWGDGTKGK